MSIILDVILVAVFAAFVFTAAKKGFILSLLELVAVIAALFLSLQASPVVAQAAYAGFVEQSMINSVSEKITETFGATSSATVTFVDVLPQYMVNFAQSVGVDVESIANSLTLDGFSATEVATELVSNIAKPIIIGALTIIFFIIIAILLLFVLKFAAQLVAKLFKLPIIGTANKLLGGVLGACKGVLVVVFVCTIMKLLFAGSDNEIGKMVNDSYVVGFIDNINPFIESLKEIY